MNLQQQQQPQQQQPQQQQPQQQQQLETKIFLAKINYQVGL